MNKNTFIFFLFILVLSTACQKKKKNKDEDVVSTTGPVQNNPPPPNFVVNIPTDAHGVFMASVVPYKFTTGWTTQLGNASAFIYTAPGNYNYLDAGTVKCNDTLLAKLSSNSYYFQGKPVDGAVLSGIWFTNGAVWQVSGNSSNNISSFTFSNTTPPTTTTLTSATSFTHAGDYNATFNAVTGADSISLILSCDSNTIKKTVPGNATSCYFSSLEIGSVKKAGPSKPGYLNIVPYKITHHTISGKKFYFVNTITASFPVTVE